MVYRIELTPAAKRDLVPIPKKDLKRVDAHILALAKNPRPPGVKALTGKEGFLRVRVGDYRIIYQIRDDILLVLVVRIRHRRDVYRGL